MLYFSGGELLILLLSDRIRGWTDYINPVGEGYTWVSVICEHHLFLVYSCPRVRLLGSPNGNLGCLLGPILGDPRTYFFPLDFLDYRKLFISLASQLCVAPNWQMGKCFKEKASHLSDEPSLCIFFSQGSGNSSPSYLQSNSVMLSKGCMFAFCLALVY